MLHRDLLCAGVSLLSVIWAIAGCETPPPEVFDPRVIQQTERDSATDIPMEILRPLPTTRQGAYTDIGPNGQTQEDDHPYRPATGPSLSDELSVRMSLQEIIHRAVINNHDVKVAAYQPAIEGARVIEAAANFDPVFFANGQYQQKHEINGGEFINSFNGGEPVITNLADAELGQVQMGVQQNLASGGQIQLQYQATYNWFNPQQTASNPYWQNNLSLSLTQPLLRNFGYDVNQAQIVINQLNQKVSRLEFRKAVETNVANIEKAYWQLVQAYRDIAIQEQLIDQTEKTYNVLYNRMLNLDVSPLQTSQAQTQLELRRSQLIQFKSQARDLSYQLKGLMSDPEFPVTSSVQIVPADAPVDEQIQFDLQDQVNTAMENRFELGEQQLKIDEAAVTLVVAKNNLLPELDFIASGGPEGADSDVGVATVDSLNFNHTDFSVGFKFQLPIGNRAARAIYQRSLYQHMQAIEQYSSFIETISVDVTSGLNAVNTDWDVVRSSRRARFAAEDALDRINKREANGEPLTPEFVQLKLQIQDSLAEAYQNEAEAIANYNIALSQLEFVKGTILRYDNVVLQEDPLETQRRNIFH
jgi:outer membrane protein TolC